MKSTNNSILVLILAVGVFGILNTEMGVVGIVPNDASIVRLVGAMMLEQNDEWSLNRRYMQLEGLQTLSCECYGVVRRHYERLLPQAG